MEQLTLPEPARGLWARIRGDLDRLRVENEAEPQDWMIGGGSILAARWRHRVSYDIDVVTSARWPTDGLGDRSSSNALTHAMRKLGGRLVEYNKTLVRMSFRSCRLDIMRSVPSPSVGHASASVDGRPCLVLSTTQILTGKLEGRGLKCPARDLYDFVSAERRDPAALERAVNAIDPDALNDVLVMWAVREEKIVHEAEATLRPMAPDSSLVLTPDELVKRAADAMLGASYTRIDAQPAAGDRPPMVVTATGNGTVRETPVPTGTAERVLEATGLNKCLAARDVDRDGFIRELHRNSPPASSEEK